MTRYALRISGPRIAGTVALNVETLRAAQACARAWWDLSPVTLTVRIVNVETGEEVWTYSGTERRG